VGSGALPPRKCFNLYSKLCFGALLNVNGFEPLYRKIKEFAENIGKYRRTLKI
jgi:hypothetical protein